ncbi:cytochrome C biogenesis protein [Halieaceae bacterium IMCC14734]|uniref:Cytochrome C biogenesis protein n=2 Tax=Candidatus Litorirhabdus singularis TaxID=2518993 RepID=A0ABT3TK95_9GAMM|nr:cytochrome C biogenesis protein [Candidatus Litorirhabdus singularis]
MVVTSFTAAAIYLLVATLQYRSIRSQQPASRTAILSLSWMALLLHAVCAIAAIQYAEGINLGFFKISAIISLIINLAFLLNVQWRPVQNLLIILYPIAAITVVTASLAPGNQTPLHNLTGGMLLHIGSSILAYAVLTLAACQAGMVALQDYQLRHRHPIGLVQILPPLQVMEKILFEMLWAGLLLLTLSIGSGMVFLENMFAQQLAHKTVLSICAWALFAVLLWGHHQLGWRSQTAVRFTLTGFIALMLAYFGSKLVLEVILQ